MNLFKNASVPLSPIPTDIPERCRPISDIKVVLFDVYGTLVVSGSGEVGSAVSHQHNRVIQEVLISMEILDAVQAQQVELASLYFELIRRCHERKKKEGIRFPEVDIVEIWSEMIHTLEQERIITPGTSVTHTRELLERLAIEFEIRSNPTWPMPGALGTLRRIREMGLLLGIVSNAQFYTPIMLHSFLGSLEDLGFSKSLCSWSYSMGEAKPSPRIFEKVLPSLTAMGIERSQVVYIGNDMLNDVWTAQQVGLRSVLFAGDKRSLRLRSDLPECSSIVPDAVVKSLARIPVILDGSLS